MHSISQLHSHSQSPNPRDVFFKPFFIYLTFKISHSVQISYAPSFPCAQFLYFTISPSPTHFFRSPFYPYVLIHSPSLHTSRICLLLSLFIFFRILYFYSFIFSFPFIFYFISYHILYIFFHLPFFRIYLFSHLSVV